MKYRSFLPVEENANNYTETYEVKTANSFSIITGFFEFSATFIVRITIKNLSKNNDIFTLNIESDLKQFLTTNNKINYNSLLHQLLCSLTLDLSKSGTIEDIVNYNKLQEDWASLRKKIRVKYRKQKNIQEVLQEVDVIVEDKTILQQYISNNTFIKILLKPVCFSDKNFPYSSKGNIYRLLGKHNLPVIEQTFESDNNENEQMLKSTAIIDTKIFNRNEYVRWLKTEVDIYDLKVILDLDYEALFTYENKLLTKAECFIATGVSGCFSNTIAHTLAKINTINNSYSLTTN